MSKQAKLALAILAGAIAIAAAMILLRPSPEQEAREEQAPLVQTVAFQAGSGPIEVLASGTVDARERVTVASEIGGRVTYVNPNFVEGANVARGAVLIRIDPSDFQNRVRSARADVAAQDVAVLQAREEVRVAEAEIARFEARQDGGNIFAPAIDESDYASRILPPEGIASRRAQAGRADVSANRLATREPQLRSAQAARDRAAANLADARLALSRTTVRAPFYGAVESESVARGSFVQPGQALGTIAAGDAFEVRLSLSEDEAALVPGLLSGNTGRIPANVYFDYGGRTFRWDAYVARADGIRDPATRLIEVFLRVPSPSGGQPLDADADAQSGPVPPLLIGSFVRAGIVGASVEQYAAIEPQHLRPGNEIWVVRDGKLRILPVRVLQRSDEMAYITTPTLSRGGRLVTSDLRAPVDGMAVRVQSVSQRASRNPAKVGASSGE